VTPAGRRDPRIDALRGFALGGILLVNIQSFLSGASSPVGYLPPQAGLADRAAYFLTATFVLNKFMPLFAMLFGAGFALLYDRLKAEFADDARRLYRRRLLWLLAFGLLHGLFLYFGDITHTYAIAGLLLLWHADSDLAAVGRATFGWWALAIGWLMFTNYAVPSFSLDDLLALSAEVQQTFDASTSLGYWAQWPVRAELFAWQLQSNLINVPPTVALMMTGLLVQRAGWLRDFSTPGWRRAWQVGLGLGLPTALAYGIWALRHATALDNLAQQRDWTPVVTASLMLSFFYAAMFLRHAPQRVVQWLAPAGRMPLTNYLLQSVAMGMLLTGWGLGLGRTLSYWQLSVLALAIFTAQVLLSRAWLSHFAQGPLEAAWRRFTYRGAQPGSDWSR
jgi:uncharacterized protein